MRGSKLRRFTTWHLDLLERYHHSLSDRDHEAQDERALVLIAAASLIRPTSQKRRKAAVATMQDEDRHSQLVWHIPGSQYRVVEYPESADRGTDGAVRTDLVDEKSCRDHEDEIDRTDAGGDVVDLWGAVHSGAFQVQREVLDHVAKVASATRSGHGECVYGRVTHEPQVNVQKL